MDTTASPRFVIVEGDSRRTVAADSLSLGRKSSAALVVRDPGVSRLHASIDYRDGRFVLRDAGSTNGTFVAGRRIVEHTLVSGEEISLGGAVVESLGGAAPADRCIRVSIAENVCTLLVPVPAPGEGTLPADVTAEMARFEAAGQEPGVPEATAPLSMSLIVRPPVRGKARYRGGRWLPTSDLATRPLRRWAALAVGSLCLLAGGALLRLESAQHLTPGGLSPAHMTQAFETAAGEGSACSACHRAWHGVPDAACRGCHGIVTLEPHRRLELACKSCHREHRVRAAGEGMVPRHRCTDCHVGAHSHPPREQPERKHTSFLNRSFSAPLVHADHRALGCADCHASEQDQKSGRVTTGCAECHGGATGKADARCLSCHRYHEAPARRETGFTRRAPLAPRNGLP